MPYKMRQTRERQVRWCLVKAYPKARGYLKTRAFPRFQSAQQCSRNIERFCFFILPSFHSLHPLIHRFISISARIRPAYRDARKHRRTKESSRERNPIQTELSYNQSSFTRTLACAFDIAVSTSVVLTRSFRNFAPSVPPTSIKPTLWSLLVFFSLATC
jgi:hypothetical protein